MEKDPFNHICYRIEIKWCRTKTKGERDVNVELTSPSHAKWEVVIWVNWAMTGNPANNLINLNVLERKILRINAVVHTSTPWGRQINYQAPFARLSLLTEWPQNCLHAIEEKGEEEKGSATLPRETSLARYASTMWKETCCRSGRLANSFENSSTLRGLTADTGVRTGQAGKENGYFKVRQSQAGKGGPLY